MSASRILVIKLGALGDFIYALGPMAAIRRHHPNDHITLLTTAPFEKMARACGYFDDVILDIKPKRLNLLGWLNLRKMLNQGAFTRVYDLQNNDRTSLYFKLFSLRPEWVGAVKGASHRNDSPERSKMHAFLGHKQTLGIAGIDGVELDSLHWMKGDGAETYQIKPPYALIVPGCSPEHPEKRWPVEQFRKLIGKLILHGIHPVLLGAKDDAETTNRIKRGLEGVVDLTGKTTLADIPALARGAAFAMGNDTGPMHMCAMTGCPVVMVFCNQTSSIAMHAPPKDKDVYAFEAMDLKDIPALKIWECCQKIVAAN